MIGDDDAGGTIGLLHDLLHAAAGPGPSRSAIDAAAASVYAIALLMSAFRSLESLHEFRQRVDGLGDCALVAQGAQHGVEVGDDFSDQLVPVGERVCHRRGLGEKRVDGGALALERR